MIESVKRMKNEDQFDVQMTLPGPTACPPICIEVKGRRSFSNNDLWIVASKLFSSSDRMIGILVVRNCCDYWGQSKRSETNRSKLSCLLSLLKTEPIGIVYFIRMDGTLETLKSGKGKRRLIVIQVAYVDSAVLPPAPQRPTPTKPDRR